MKRYVAEFANEFLKVKKYPESSKQKINKIIKFTEKGMITSVEAIREIVRIIEDDMEE